MGSNKRPALSRIYDNPGPGSYDPANSMKKEGPALRGRSSFNVKDSPGPGAYSPDVKQSKNKAPSFGMGSEGKKTICAKPLNSNPGPGNYYKYGFKGGPSFGFGTSTRMSIKKNDSPGPGSYKIPTKVRNLETYSLNKNKFSYV